MRPQSLNPARLTELFRKQFQLCRVSRGETLVVLSDLGARREYTAAAFAAARELGASIYEMCVSDAPKWTSVGVPTVGACKGAVDALKAADMLVCLHVPLFTKWLREVRDGGTRVLLVRDHPDDLEQCMSPPGLKEAVLHAAARYRKAKELRVTSAAGTDLSVQLGEYPVNKQYGIADEKGHFDHWGSGLCIPFRTRAAPRAAWLFSRATSSSCPTATTSPTRSALSARRLHPRDRGRHGSEVDEALAGWQPQRPGRQGRLRGVPPGLGHEPRRALG